MAEINPIQALKMIADAFAGEDGILDEQENANVDKFNSIFANYGGTRNDLLDIVKTFAGKDGKLDATEMARMEKFVKNLTKKDADTTPAVETQKEQAQATAPAKEEQAAEDAEIQAIDEETTEETLEEPNVEYKPYAPLLKYLQNTEETPEPLVSGQVGEDEKGTYMVAEDGSKQYGPYASPDDYNPDLAEDAPKAEAAKQEAAKAEAAKAAEQKADDAAKIPAVPADTEHEDIRKAYEYLSGAVAGGVDGKSIEELEQLEKENEDRLMESDDNEDDSTFFKTIGNNLSLYIAYRKGDKETLELLTAPSDIKPVLDATKYDAALTYQYAPNKNITVNMKDAADRQEYTAAIEAVAKILPKTETDGLDMDTARNLTLQEIDAGIKANQAQIDDSDNSDHVSGPKEAVKAYTALRDVVMKHSDKLSDGPFRTDTPAKEEETGILSATGDAIASGAEFVNEHVLRVGDARNGAKNAGKRVEAQYKTNGPISGIISTVGNTAALGTTAASGIIGTVTDAGEALTDAVDNMEEGAAKDAARTGSGLVKFGNGVLNASSAAVDGVSSFFKEGLYINRLWGGKGNDEAIDELVRGAIDNITDAMLPKTQKDGESDEEFAARLEQDKVEYSYIVDVKHRLGLNDETLAKMDADEVRARIVDAVNNENIPLDVIKAFAPKKIAEKGMQEQSELLNTDGQEGLSKAKKAGGQIVDGVVDLSVGTVNTVDNVAGALIGKGWLWGKPGLVKSFIPDDETTGAAAPIHTASTKEITQAERDKQLEAWKADFKHKFEENKEKIIDAIIPDPDKFISLAIEEILEGTYTSDQIEDMSKEELEEAKNKIKREVYEQLGNTLEEKFSDYEAHRLFQRSLNAGAFGEDSNWTAFWNEIDNVKAQENTAGDRGFLANFGSYLWGAMKFPATAVLTDAPYTIAQVAGGVPFWKFQIAFAMFLGSDEHINGAKNIIGGKYNSAQKAAGWDEEGYATIKDIVVWWAKHHAKKIVKKEEPCKCKDPDPKPEPEPDPPTPDEVFIEDPGSFHLTD